MLEGLDCDNSQFPENVLDVRRFVKSLSSQGVSARRCAKYVGHFKNLFNMLGKPLRFASKDDVEDLCLKIRGEQWAEWTKHDYLITLRKFLKFVDDNEERAKLIKVPNVPNKYIPETEVLSREDLSRLERAAGTDIRQRTIVRLLFESAGAANEFCTMIVEDAWFQDELLLIHLRGTKNRFRDRVIPIADEDAVALFKRYLEAHSQRNNPKAFLWLNGRADRLSDKNLWDLLKELGKRAELNKRVNPHWFRHSRVTELAKSLTDQQLKIYTGWSPNSKMAGNYVHLGVNSLIEAFRKTHPEGKETKKARLSKEFKKQLVKEMDIVDLIIDRFVERGQLPLLQEAAEAFEALPQHPPVSGVGLGQPELSLSALAGIRTRVNDVTGRLAGSLQFVPVRAHMLGHYIWRKC